MKKPKQGPAEVAGSGGKGLRSERIFEEEQKYIAPGFQGIALYSRLALASGRNEIVVDEDGKEYIDFVSGIGATRSPSSPKHVTSPACATRKTSSSPATTFSSRWCSDR